ncbi:MAG: anti-sigma-factor antagonist [Solirubrobacterales bacterium]|nr:anti-sigma-factor antagonist [Solirubrobacterales bacterium]
MPHDNLGDLPTTTTTRTAADAQTHLVSVIGEVDLGTIEELRPTFRAALDSDPARRIVIDLGACEFIDSAGVAALLRFQGQAEGRDLLILPGPPAVQRVFAVLGLLDRLPFAE